MNDQNPLILGFATGGQALATIYAASAQCPQWLVYLGTAITFLTPLVLGVASAWLKEWIGSHSREKALLAALEEAKAELSRLSLLLDGRAEPTES